MLRQLVASSISAAAICSAGLSPALAQQDPPPAIVEQQQQLQSLLNNATVAIRNNDEAQACLLRSQAGAILNTNIDAFNAVFPANDWSDLQTSLQDSLARCSEKGLLPPAG